MAAPTIGVASSACLPGRDQYGPNNTTPPELAESSSGEGASMARLHVEDQYGPRRPVRGQYVPNHLTSPTGPEPSRQWSHNKPAELTAATVLPSPSAGWHRHKTDLNAEESFIADAAAARRSRLRRAANSWPDSLPERVRNRSGPTDSVANRQAVLKPGETPTPGSPFARSAAERVRNLLGPSPSTKQRPTRGEPASARDGGRQLVAVATKADERNAKRLKEANAADRLTLGESPSLVRSCGTGHLPGDASLFFPAPIIGPCDDFDPPSWFLEAIQAICSGPSTVPTKSPLCFELSEQAAEHNAEVLRAVDFELGRLIQDHSSSTLGFGSEFRQVSELRPLLGRHPHFPRLEKLFTEGMHYVFNRELSPGERRKELVAMLARGNHKSAQQEPDRVGTLLSKDVTHGFTIPLPISVVEMIPGAMVQPLGLVSQWTIDHNGERKVKDRLTQDLSFSTDRTLAPTSINARIDMASYVEMVYGWCLPRIIHYIVSLRSQNPTLLILISKYDYSDAYRRIAHSADAASQTIAINGTTAYLSLRLTFGGAPNPPSFCTFGEVVTDLSNEIGQCDEWDPTEIRSPAQPLTPEPLRLPAHIPVAQARQMAVVIPPTKSGGRVDDFIDDLINVFLDTPRNCLRQPNVVPLAMHLTSRPHAGDDKEPIPRRPILSIPKLIAEGRPEEIQVVLGWRINTRLLEISLPDDKYSAWSSDVKRVQAAGHCMVKELETLVGRLNHTAYIIPNARHFMSRIRKGLDSRGGGGRKRKLGAEALDDLLLWEGFLAHAHRGVSMNLLVTRQPDKLCWSDACPYGIGGYSLSGRAWRLQIPTTSPIYGHKGINNLLEFLGMAINIWLVCLESEGEEHCILAIGDNTSAIGWLHNTSRLDTTWDAHNAHLKVARKIASLLTDFQCCLASQHLKGELNVVADLLSFAGGASRGKAHPIAADMPANDELTCRFLASYPSQVPANFAISQLPQEILFWTTQVLQVAESYLTADKKAATNPATEPGEDGKDTADTSGMELTPSSLCYPTTRGTFSSEPSSASIGRLTGMPGANLREIVANQWSQVLCAKPQATWLRRFGAISGSAPCTSRDRQTCDRSSEPGSRPVTTSTRPNENKRPLPPSSCEQCTSSQGRDQNQERTLVTPQSPRLQSQPTSSQCERAK